jgi:hypothetical protein
MGYETRLFALLEELAEAYKTSWLDETDDYWMLRMLEEIGELAGTLTDRHDDPTELELMQISAMCLNWVRKRILDGRITMGQVNTCVWDKLERDGK